MDACGVEMVESLLVVESALLAGVVSMLAHALLMMLAVDVRAVAVLGQIGLVLLMESRALALVLGVQRSMSRLMARVKTGDGTSAARAASSLGRRWA